LTPGLDARAAQLVGDVLGGELVGARGRRSSLEQIGREEAEVAVDLGGGDRTSGGLGGLRAGKCRQERGKKRKRRQAQCKTHGRSGSGGGEVARERQIRRATLQS